MTSNFHTSGEVPVLYDQDFKRINCDADNKDQVRVVRAMSTRVIPKLKDHAETYKDTYAVYNGIIYCNLCYSIKEGLKNLEDRGTPEGAQFINLSNHVKHLQIVHYTNLDVVKAKEAIDENSINPKKKTKANKEQGTMKAFIVQGNNKVSIEKNKEKDKEFRKLLSEFIAHGAFPVAIVANPSFQQLFVKLCPSRSFTFPSVRTVTRDIKVFCTDEQETYRKQLRDKISANEAPIALTLDLSTGNNSASYYCITGHFIDKEFNFFDELLDLQSFDVKHSGQNIKKHVIKSVLDLVGCVNSNNAFSKLVTSISADCAYNNNYLDDITDVQRIRCFAHRLNTLGKTLPFIVSGEDQSVDARDIDDEVNEGRENEGIKRKKQTAKDFAMYVSCVVKLMNRLRKAPKGNKALRTVLFEYQKSKPPKPGTYSRAKGPIQGAATRWTYGPKYLRRALELIDDMSAVFKDTTLVGSLVVGNDDYSADMHQEVVGEFTECQNKRSILGYFMELFQRMEFWLLLTEGTSSPTSSIVLHALEDIEGLIDVLLGQLHTSDANLDDNDFHKQFYPVPIKVFEEFKINFSNIFKDDMNVNRPTGYNFQFFANNPVLKSAKLLDIRFCYSFDYNKNGKLKPYLPKVEEFQVIFDMYQSHRRNKSVVTEAKSDDNDVDRYESEGSSGLDDDDDEVTNGGEHEVDTDKILFDDEVKKYRSAIKQLVEENGANGENYDYVKIMNFKPLEFWKENKTIYPALSTVARGILAVPAQSASSERVFSKMTSIISSSRSSLGDDFGAMLISSAFRFKSSSIREEEIKNTAIKKKRLKKNEDNEMIFPPFRKSARSLEYIDYALLEEERDEDYNSDDDDNDDDDYDDDDDYSIASGDMFVVPRGHMKRKNQGQNSYFDDNYVTATSTGTSSNNSTGTMNKKQRSST